MDEAIETLRSWIAACDNIVFSAAPASPQSPEFRIFAVWTDCTR